MVIVNAELKLEIPAGYLRECDYYLDGRAGPVGGKKGDVCPYFKKGRCDMYDYFNHDPHHCGFTEICSYATEDGEWYFTGAESAERELEEEPWL